MTDWVIFGCGFVGRRLARRLLADGKSVRAFARHTEKLAPLAELGARVHAFDAVKQRVFGPAVYGARSPVVVYSIPPLGNMPSGEAVRRAADAALSVGATRFIYLSSTAVYGPTPEGEVVDEDSQLALSDGEAMIRIADESAVESARHSGLSTVVLRMAAIYGPGRGVRERLKAGTYKLVDEGGHMFSRVHVDDVVGVILAAAERAPTPAAVYCVSDDRPSTQKEYADWLVSRLGVPSPPTVASLAPGQPRRPVRNRAVSNARLKRELDYVLRYPTYVEGEAAIEAELDGAAPVEEKKPVEEKAPVETQTAKAPLATTPLATTPLATTPPPVDEVPALVEKIQTLWLAAILHDLQTAQLHIGAGRLAAARESLARATLVGDVRWHELADHADHANHDRSPPTDSIKTAASSLSAAFEGALKRAGLDAARLRTQPASQPELSALAEALHAFDAAVAPSGYFPKLWRW